MKPQNTTSTVRRLDDGIYMIPGSRSGGCNIFVLKGLRKNILIDVGLPEDYEYLCAGLDELDLSIQDIQMAVLTHEHYDHAGCLARLPNHIVVAAHERAANKFVLDDQFSMMSGAFKSRASSAHVDVYLEDGTLIDIGGLKLRTIYTPGHCSGAICLYEPSRGALFTADTVFAGGILGGIFASGNISDYINSLERLRELRLVSLYPGHGRMSSTPDSDLQRAINGSRLLLSDTQVLFGSIDVGGAFESIRSAAVDYSRRAAERRQSPRITTPLPAVVHVEDEETHVAVVNLSRHGALIDRPIPLARGDTVHITIEGIGSFEGQVVERTTDQTRLAFRSNDPPHPMLTEWLASQRSTPRSNRQA